MSLVPKMTHYHKKLLLKSIPEHIFKLRDIHIRNRRNEYRLNALRKMSLHLLNKLIIEHITLGDSQKALLIKEFRIILR